VFANAISGAGGATVGIGTTVAAIQAQWVQGNLSTTSNPLDLAINGGGLFRMDTNGTVTYSRNGQFHADKDGYIVNAQGARLTGYGVDANGAIVPSTPGPLQVSTAHIAPQLTTEAGIVANLDARATPITAAFDIDDASTYHNATSMTVYDSLGYAHTLTTYFTKTAANTWAVNAAVDGTPLTPPLAGTLTFNSDGSLDTTATTLPFNLSITLANGATTPLAIPLDFAGTTQFGSVFGVTSLTQDGFAAGKLSGFSVAGDGTLLGRYSNGESRTLGQVVLASFANPHGLQPLGGNAWAETSTSGQAVVGIPGSGMLGVLQSGAVEDSNVDLTAELVNMITAQRVYQANAQTIKTQDQVLNTLVNLR
jgi:flagellar hook protein FlgE